MKRRKLLKHLGLTLPTLLCMPSLLTSCKKDDDGTGKVEKYKKYKVIVIGAGAAGLYAGWFLRERGFEVTILEASAQIGGRIRSLSGFADFPIELGAEEIHGNNSAWYNIVQQTGAALRTTTTEDFYVFNETGNANEPFVKSESQAATYPEFNKAMNFVKNAPNYSGQDISVEQHLFTSGVSWNLYGVVNALLGNEYGTSNSRLSIRGLAEEDALWTAGDDSYTLKDRSMFSVLETKFAPVMGSIVKNSPVKKIDYQGEKIELTTQNNKVWQADRVIITVPVKVLQDGDITFTPPLPSTKKDALQQIGMGAGMKVIFKFSQAFWANTLTPALGSLIGYSQIPEIWSPSTGRGSTPVLTTFIMGEKAEQYSQMGNQAINNLLFELDNVFSLGNVASQSIQQGGTYLMDWTKEPFVKGAYSYPAVGGGLIFRKELASPLDGRIFFAGEATHFKGHSGTVHGAIETGIRATEEVEASIP